MATSPVITGAPVRAPSIPALARRGFLGALAFAPAAALPALSATTVASSSAMMRWEEAYRAFVTADKAMHDYDRDYLTPASDRFMAWRDQWPMGANIMKIAEAAESYPAESALYDPAQERFDDLCRQRGAAVHTLAATPAPSAAELARKIEILIEDEEWECYGFDEIMSHLLADARRLSGRV